MSVAFYPNKGLVCYGSEQAAVKAGLNVSLPGRSGEDTFIESHHAVDGDVLRFDLDDLNGEVVLLDWSTKGGSTPLVSQPSRHLPRYPMMNEKLTMILYHETAATVDHAEIYNRMTKLNGNELILPLPDEPQDPVLTDIQDIPKICQDIQDDWNVDTPSTSLNRLTAYNLSRCLRKRLEKRIRGEVHPNATDILLTGCEVSLWLAEQFASDLQKALPNLRIKAISSNKILGMYGQDIAIPSLGFPSAPQTDHLDDAIVIIVSHSGGTFAPLSCSNLLQVRNTEKMMMMGDWHKGVGPLFACMSASLYVGLYCLLPTHSLTHSLIIPLHLTTYRAKQRTCSL